MAARYYCDGCGQELIKPPFALGLVVKRDYCPACHKIALDFNDQKKVLHEKLLTDYQKNLSKLMASHKKAHPNFKLPDHA